MPTAYNRQLKDKDDNLIYPVLNSDSIPGNAVTTAKINDGAVTSAKIGAGEVKATNIDFTTIPIALGGITENKSCPNGSTKWTINLPQTLPSTNYYPVASLTAGGSGWGSNNFTKWKTRVVSTSQFEIEVWNDTQTTITGVGFNWVVVHMPS